MSAATWDDLGPEARVLRDVMRSRAFGAVAGEAGPQETQGTCHVADAAARRLAARDRAFSGITRDSAKRSGAHDVAQDAGLGAEVVPGRRGHGLGDL